MARGEYFDDVAVAALIAAVLSAARFDEGGQPVAGHRVGDDGAALFLEQDGGDEGDEPVAVDLFPLFVHGAGAVYVGIEDDAEVRARLLDPLRDGVHRLLVFGVGDMVGEVPVGLQKLAALRVRAQRRKHLVHIKAARAVAGVHHDLFAGEGLFLPRHFAHEAHQPFAVAVDIAKFSHAAAARKRRAFRRHGEDVGDVFAFQPALGGEKFQSVFIEGEVAGRDHHRCVGADILFLQQHEHRRGGGEARDDGVAPALRHRLDGACRNAARRQARIVPDGDGQLLLAASLRRPGAESLHDARQLVVIKAVARHTPPLIVQNGAVHQPRHLCFGVIITMFGVNAVIAADNVRRPHHVGPFRLYIVMERVGNELKLRVDKRYVVVERRQSRRSVIFSVVRRQNVVAVYQLPPLKVISKGVKPVIIQAVGDKRRVAVFHDDVMPHLCDLRLAIVEQIVACQRERVALQHPDMAECLERIGSFVNHGAIAKHKQVFVPQIDFSAQQLRSRMAILVVSQVVGMD